ncbi:MAG: hypothetical protein Q7U91_07350 [Sideroxyarcus sp.]|nr:hypothetical protein [Sideroxyarcus sp.]
MQKFISKSKEQASMLMRRLLSPSMRFQLRDAVARLREQLGRARLWQWEIARFPLRRDSQFDIVYAGRKSRRDAAKLLLGAHDELNTHLEGANQTRQSAFVSEMPFRNALRVPNSLRAIVSLNRPMDEIMEGYQSELRRRLRKHRGLYRMQQVRDHADIERADIEMLQPYACSRHGTAASQISSDVVRRLAQETGRLDLVLYGDEVVACHLGCEFVRNGKRYWSTIRFGYTEAVFSDPKRLKETNSINVQFALEWAHNNGFDYYDIGTTGGSPEDGLLQWKKRRAGGVSSMGHHDHFHVRLPNPGSAQFLWEVPLFAIEGDDLTLHLGIPHDTTAEEAAIRFSQMNFGGLSKTYLHCAKPPDEQLLEKMRNLYKHLKSPPSLKVISSS